MAVIQGAGGGGALPPVVKPTVNSINLMPPVVKPPTPVVQTSLQAINSIPAPTINSVNRMPVIPQTIGMPGVPTYSWGGEQTYLSGSNVLNGPYNAPVPQKVQTSLQPLNATPYTGGHPSFATPPATQNRLTMADYNATQRFIDEANQGRWMGLITPNMLLASGGALTPDLLSMNGYTQNTNGSWTRNNPIDNTLGDGGSGGGGGGGGYGGGGYGGGGGSGNAADLINWRIGF